MSKPRDELDLYDDLFRTMRSHQRATALRRKELAAQDAVLEEERRVAAWLERPEWRTFWSEEARDFRVPEGWPEGRGQSAEQPPGAAPRSEAPPDTFMHRMLPKR